MSEDNEAIRVLFLDDTPTDVELACEELRSAGVRLICTTAHDEQSFVAALEGGEPFDVILSDYKLPQFDGERARQMAAVARPDVPVVFVSAALGDGLSAEAVRTGAVDYVGKAHLEALPAAVRRAVRNGRERARRRELERKAASADAQFRSLVEHVRGTAIYLLDNDGVIRSWNRGAEAMNGFAADEAVGMPYEQLFLPEDRAAGDPQRQLEAAAARGEFRGTGRRRRKDGPPFDAEVVITALRDPDGTRRGFLKIVRDVTDRLRHEREREALLAAEQAARARAEALAEQARASADQARASADEAERAGRMKDEFLATLGHELRTPLNAVLGWAQVLARGGATGPDAAAGLAAIERNARAQAQIIEDLLDMSRIISGKVRLDVRPADVSAAVRAAADTCRPAADAKGVRLNAVIDPGPGLVSGDPDRLQQVFWNLLSNAVKFTPRGGRVQVVVGRVDSHVEVAVSDTGEGIRPDFLPHVFDRFRQADGSTTRRHGGLGLGLSIVKNLVELHGGSVRAESAGPGTGSTFVVALPLAAVRSVARTGTDGDGDGRDGDGHPKRPPADGVPLPGLAELCDRLAGLRIIVVDDEPDARTLLGRVLADCGAKVSAVGSAAEALARVSAERPDVLVSDIGMPNEDGYELIRKVRSLDPTAGGDVPALALTAYARADDRVRAMLAGFHMHVPKPVEPAELVAVVASLAGRRAADAPRPGR